jgi:ABC-type Fe3+ transport system permease subunit
MTEPNAHHSTTLRRLKWVRWIAILDALLLVPLVIAAVTDAEGLVSVLGPVHGLGFVGLCVLIGLGALEGLWGWWFLVMTIVTLGPPGSLLGDVRIRRRMRAAAA